MSSHRPDRDGRGHSSYAPPPSGHSVQTDIASAAYRAAAANETLNIDKFRPRSPTPERDPNIVAYLAAQEAAKSNSGSSRRGRIPLTAEQNRARREKEIALAGGASSSGTGLSTTFSSAAVDHDGPSDGGPSGSSFAGVTSAKSRYQREKEEAERKAKEAEEEAARAYEEFTADMAGPGGWNERRQGSAARSGGRSAASAPSFVSASNRDDVKGESSAARYVPSRSAHSSTHAAESSKTATTSAKTEEASKPVLKRPLDMFGDDADDEPQKKPVKSEPPGKKMRVMEDFLGQLQRDQAAREERFKGRLNQGASISSILAFEGQRQGSRDLGDPLTTNVCVLNLPANITEDAFGNFFSQWGDVGSVKVMWPRGDELGGIAGGAGAGITAVRRMQSAGLTGFVCYMRREDSELAIRESDGMNWAGSLIKTGWGKAMPIPARAQYYAPKRIRRERSPSPASTRRHKAETADAALRRHRDSHQDSYEHNKSSRRDRSMSPRTKCRAKAEGDHYNETLNIRTVVERIRQHGPRFEDLLREKERDNPRFAFFWDEKSILHQYFNVLVDPRYEPDLPLDSFRDEGDAGIWSSDSGEDSETEGLRKQRREVIGPAALRRFEAMLRSLTPRRERIARCMIFALDHAHACEQVVDVLCQSLLVPSTPIPRKLARLYVVSDILHNSANQMPNVWKYRLVLEKRLPEVFEHLGDIGRSFPSRMKAESWKQMVGNVLGAWESWLVFPSGVLEVLGGALLAPAAAPASEAGQPSSRIKRSDAFDEDDGEAFDPNAV
ncbi:hypothetical protein OC846_001178 [Tilletia horrida]|uniref:CID domain-containing protein n=1 Tax=Tilletia horrida TaxID=155126 RepID=A0AAN6GUP5_9BASI|nr:hypothetical protein OC846_001178 [Tilletia horrida]